MLIYLNESGFLKSDINCLTRELKNILIKRNEEYLDYIIRMKEKFSREI